MAEKIRNQNFKIGFYVRVSTEEQAENPEGSIRNQVERLKEAVAYRNRNGNFGEIVEAFIDPGISAKNMRRPKLQELLRAIRNREINLIMVTELSRLSRNTRDFIQMWDMMRAHDCRFQSLREDFDTTNAAGELLLFQLMNLAQFERRQTSERVEANIAVRSARGLYNGGLVPFGYKLIPERSGYLEVDEEMGPVVRAAFTAFLREGSLAKTACWLNENGYSLRKQTEGGGSFRRVGHFTVDNLHKIFRNKCYLGVKVYRHKGETKEARAVWPALIDENTFNRVQKVLEKNRQHLKPWKQGRLPYILTGLVHCAKCNSQMPGKSATGNGGKTGYYEHSWATKRDSTLSKKLFRCEPHRVPSKKLEPVIWDKLMSLITSETMMKEILQRVRKHHEENPLRKDQERLRAKIGGVSSQLEALGERLAEIPKGISAAPIYKQMEKLEGIKKEHEEALAELMSGGKTSLGRIAKLLTFDEFASHYRHFVSKEASVPERKQLIQKFVKKVEVGTETIRLHYIVDEDHYKRELALLGAGSASAGACRFSKDVGSYTLTFGARGGT